MPRACPSRSSPMFASAMSSSSTGAWPVHSAMRCARISAVSPMRRRYWTCASLDTRMDVACIGVPLASHVVDFLRQLVEGRVAIHLVFHRVEVLALLARVARDDVV